MTQKLLGRNLVVDGSTDPVYEHAVFDSDPELGRFPPYIVFDIDAQKFIGPECATREEAEQVLRVILVGGTA